ncbi:YhcN/YlaJ family sporulation lipoprotein [Priestia koreensis]|uniref:YhcN/YlaJ family sporulation lipoprotein n=1 Tax=Priestia koreensis TaxID=284581 RepID=UPI001F566519|nr:YhcN/YlaJ family sporulation lipoprotein [Priestia koreensis]MCM3004445.1 YhcN/YlaJ family sporulation lipoprotein [Priestia koreensis]UNL84656.1 YhcN/YlaJ family sporulation lipoprotein [Priestia koreensis]
MNKHFLVAFTTIAIITVSGCQSNTENQDEALYEENGETLNVSDRNDLYNTNKKDQQDYGYVRHTKNPDHDQSNMNKGMISINREKVADSISRMATSIPNIHDVATLVTDDEVLIAYKTDNPNRNEAADQVKRTAMSVVPRYYHVYVSDNPEHIKDVERFSTLDTKDENTQTSLQQTIRSMLKSPQGNRMSTGEDANGHTKGAPNGDME